MELKQAKEEDCEQKCGGTGGDLVLAEKERTPQLSNL